MDECSAAYTPTCQKGALDPLRDCFVPHCGCSVIDLISGGAVKGPTC